MKPVSLQDRFLAHLCKNKVPVTVIVTNGYQIKNATVAEFDSFVVLLNTQNTQTLLFKHAISSITPNTPITLASNTAEEE